jgi:hypothetical protein
MLTCAFVAPLFLPYSYLGDTWLALVAGREVWAHGLPHHDMLTIWTLGHPWIDQQWLSQLSTYALWRAGGLGLLGVVYTCAMMGTLSWSVLRGRRRGAGTWGALAILFPSLWLVLVYWIIRPQFFAYPLFLGLLILLLAEKEAPSRRVWLALPLLVLWANLHGSVTLGIGLVGLYALTEARRAPARAIALIVLAPATILATPYGTSILSYYHSTLLNTALPKYVTEWKPLYDVTQPAVIFLAPIIVLFLALPWVLRRQATWFERLATLALAAAAVMAVRNVIWLAMAAPLLLSPALPTLRWRWHPWRRRSRREPHRRLNTALAIFATATLVTSLCVVGTQSDHFFEKLNYPSGATSAIAAQEPGAGPVYADAYFSDYLLWRLPALAGHMAYDDRFELLSASQMRTAVLVGQGKDAHAACGYRLLAFETSLSPGATRSLGGSARVLYRAPNIEILLRPAASASCPKR